MSSRKTYRTIILLDRDHKLLYGHSILWYLSEIDYNSTSWKKKNFAQIDVFFKDIDETEFEAFAYSGKLKISHGKTNIEVFLPSGRERIFLEQKYDADEYNPFISLCTWADYFYPENQEEHDVEYIQNNKEQLDKIESDFNLPISKHPHLLETFTIFTPTRLEEHFSGVDNSEATGYEIAFTDQFSLYQAADVKVEATSNGTVNTHNYKLDKHKHVVEIGSVPDSVITTVSVAGEIIFSSSFSLLKKISIKSNVVSTKRIEHNGEIISQTVIDESTFDV